MPVTDITTLIAQVGFPMAIAVYMLGRTDRRLDALTKSINDLNNIMRDNVAACRYERSDRHTEQPTNNIL